MNQAEIHFTSATAWNFFLKLVIKFTVNSLNAYVCKIQLVYILYSVVKNTIQFFKLGFNFSGYAIIIHMINL